MFDYIIKSLPVLLVLIVYFCRLEVRLALIKKDLCWIKKRLGELQ